MKKVVVSLAVSALLATSVVAATRDREAPRDPERTIVQRIVERAKQLLPKKVVKAMGDWPSVPPPNPGP